MRNIITHEGIDYFVETRQGLDVDLRDLQPNQKVRAGNGETTHELLTPVDYKKAFEASKSALKGLLDLLSEVDDIAYNEKKSAYELSYWLKKQIKPIMVAEEMLK